MLTFKQMETLYWIARLGSFEAAALRLNTTQSAISKRVQELESAFEVQVFERLNRGARLTAKGSEMFEYAEQMLEQREEFVRKFSSNSVIARRVRIGVTELTALTWLPRLIAAVNVAFPKVVVEAEVDLSSVLRAKLAENRLDIIFVPEGLAPECSASTAVGSIENAWMCAPTTLTEETTLSLRELAGLPLIVQGSLSGTGLLYRQFLTEQGVEPTRLIVANNLIAQIGLTVSGLGVSYLPRLCVQYLVASNSLREISVTPALPPLNFVALYQQDSAISLHGEIARIAAESCDFGSNLLDPQR